VGGKISRKKKKKIVFGRGGGILQGKKKKMGFLLGRGTIIARTFFQEMLGVESKKKKEKNHCGFKRERLFFRGKKKNAKCSALKEK